MKVRQNNAPRRGEIAMPALGKHAYEIEGDTVVLRSAGQLQPDEARELHQLCEGLLAEKGRLYLLLDLSCGSELPSATRREMGRWNATHEISGVAIFGMSPLRRALLLLLANALSLVRRKPLPFHLAQTEAEARTWLAALRPAPAASP